MTTVSLTTPNNSIELHISDFEVMNDILCDNPFNYPTNYVGYYNGVETGEQRVVEEDDLSALLFTLQCRGVAIDTPLILNGCEVSISLLIACEVFVTDERATWRDDMVNVTELYEEVEREDDLPF